jgi:class 3 adenylate cyclase/tetratricopeptide (TPR) repeat protein
MQCPRCQHENPSDAVFCQECGGRLEAACPSCGTSNQLGAKFCKKCGQRLSPREIAQAAPGPRFGAPETYTPKHLAERILSSKSALEGERKQVTVLFADLKGSMELLADRDPEEARGLLDPVLERMIEAVHRYEGTVNQVMGDGIMALFGAPLACEDHAVRACYAALRMQDTVTRYAEGVRRAEGVPLQIRVGLNSGEVVVRAIGSDLHMDYTAVGQTTHVAARMEQMALPGSILLSGETLALAEGYVEAKGLGPLPVKGLAAPLEVYELTRAATVRSRFHAATARGLTRFVGRESELEHLRQALARAAAGHGQVAAVVGEPGVGKSRLYWEFSHAQRAQGWLILESGSVSYGKATNYLPIIELLRVYFAIDSTDDARKLREKVTGKLLSLDRQLEPCILPILWLLDVPIEDEPWARLDPPERRRRVLEAVKWVILRESQVQPLIVLFEDLHWIDAETQAFLDSLVDSLPGSRVLLLVNYRPEYQHGWGSKTYYRQLQVEPLPPESAEAVLDALLGRDGALASLKRLVIERTDGNPFFIEETVRSLVETGVLAGERGGYRLARVVQGLQVPATAQAMLAARIDRLAPEDKRLLQAAAVIGTDVPFALLQAVADEPEDRLRQGLAQLQATEFLYETRLFPDPEYTFRHALTHEVAYGSLLAERRRTLHARIVGAMEKLYDGRLAEHVEQLAHHALRGELREKAVHYLRQAGLKAAARSALPEALASFEQALAVVATLPERQSTLEEAFDIRLELRWVLHQLGDIRGALAQLREAEACAERLNDDPRRGRACAFMTVTHSQLGELEEALASGTRALEIAGRVGDVRLRILATDYLANVQYYRGEYERVIELATANLAALPADGAKDDFGLAIPPSVFDRSVLVLSFAQLGRFDEAAAYEAEAIRLAEPTHHAYTIAEAHFAASQFRLLKGDWAKARALVERWIAVIRTGNVAVLLPLAVTISAWVLAQLGETSEALNRLREGERLLERQAATGIVGRLGWAYCSLSRACLLLSRLDEARCLGDRAVEFSSRQPGFAAHALHLLGDIATHPDRFDAERGEGHYRQAMALAQPRGMRPLVAHAHLGLGKLCQRVGRRQEAQGHFTTAVMMYREMGMGCWLEKAEAELGPPHRNSS